MRKFLFTVVLAIAVSSRQAMAQAPVPMHQEPRHHLVLDSVRFRVMDVQIPPKDTTLFHIHDSPAIFVAITVSPTDDQVLGGKWSGTAPNADPGRRPGDVKIDTTYIVQPVTHRVTNVGTNLFRLIAVTSSASASPTPDTVGANEIPGVAEIRSTWFLQTRLRMASQTQTGWYVSRSPVILVQPFDGRTQVLLKPGTEQHLNVAGAWIMVPAGVRYRLSNSAQNPATILAIQVR